MAASGPRFCPRCGTARVGEMAYCPNCGLDLGQLPTDEASAGGPTGSTDVPAPPEGSTAGLPAAAAFPPLPADDSPATPPLAPPVAPPTAVRRYDALRERSAWGPLLVPGLIVLLLLLAAAWLAGFGPFARPGDPSGPFAGGASETQTPSPTPTSPFLPPVTAQPSFSVSPGFTAPPVGLSILSPADGSVVGAREVTVIGTAPPGLRITHDISFGLDRHATADGTGHWAIQADLSEGENQLNFRIGDDRSTMKTIRVFYLAPSTP